MRLSPFAVCAIPLLATPLATIALPLPKPFTDASPPAVPDPNPKMANISGVSATPGANHHLQKRAKARGSPLQRQSKLQDVLTNHFDPKMRQAAGIAYHSTVMYDNAAVRNVQAARTVTLHAGIRQQFLGDTMIHNLESFFRQLDKTVGLDPRFLRELKLEYGIIL